MPLVLGIDGGTEGVRAGLFDTVDGREVAYASAAYGTVYPRPGWAEQAPADWWAAAGVAVRTVLAGVDVTTVAAMAVDTTCCSVVALSADGEPLRPCLLWMDVRAAQEAADISVCGDCALAVNGGGAGPVSAEWLLCKALWLKRNEPETWAATATLCEYQDFINLKLTGQRVASSCNAAVRWHWHEGVRPPLSLLTALGLEDLLPKLPAVAISPGAMVGELTPAAAAHLGLPAGLPVAQGGADAFIGMLGLGVLAQGELALLTGSSHLHLGVLTAPVHGKGCFGSYAGALGVGDVHVLEGGQTSTGSVVAWLRRMFSAPGQPLVPYALLDMEAAAIPIGCDGLICQEHFQGNRTPHTDPSSRGVFAGLTLAHTRAHLFRAVMEGVAFGTRAVLEAMQARGFQPARIVIAGGAARSELWLRITADVIGLPLHVTVCGEAPALGCAILASVVGGAHASIADAAAAMVHSVRIVEPDRTSHAAYASHYAAYSQLYHAMKQVPAAAATS